MTSETGDQIRRWTIAAMRRAVQLACRARKAWPVLCGIAAVCALLLCWASLALAPMPIPDDAEPRTIVGTAPNSAPVSGIDRSWSGTAPTPGHYVRPTRAYRAWRRRFDQVVDGLARGRAAADAQTLHAWVTGYEMAAARMSVSRPAVPPLLARRKIAPPPTPAFERFYGYKVVLPWNRAVYYYEAQDLPPDTPYLVHSQGIKEGGQPVRDREDIHLLFACAGVTDPVAKNVLIKVSQREGGFEAVNTWDTGYVSVGFIQFTLGEQGSGSLLHVLQRMKRDEATAEHPAGHPNEFAHFFTDHGIDARDGMLFVRDPATSRTCAGADAVRLIIDDKRLTAVFQDAGLRSRAFQLAQIREAYGAYYLADAPFRLPAAEVSVYQVGDAPADDAASEADGAVLLKKRYVYGEDAVNDALATGCRPEALAERVRAAAPGTILRVARRLPQLMGTYGEVLTTEGGQLTLTDRAVQCGVRNAMAQFAVSVNALAPDHPLTLRELREADQALMALLKHRIDVLAKAERLAGPASR